jgi:hypothetical protein
MVDSRFITIIIIIIILTAIGLSPGGSDNCFMFYQMKIKRGAATKNCEIFSANE